MKAWEQSEKSIEGACSVTNITHLQADCMKSSSTGHDRSWFEMEIV